jgi:hypothetical protein
VLRNDLHAGSERVATATGSATIQVDPQPISDPGLVVQIDCRPGVVVADHQVEAAVVVQVGDRHGSPVAERVAAHRSRHVGVATLADALEQELVLVAIPRVLPDELGAEEESAFILLDVCDRTMNER